MSGYNPDIFICYSNCSSVDHWKYIPFGSLCHAVVCGYVCVCVCVCEREGGVGGRGRLVTFGTTNLYFLLNPSINLLLRILSTFYGKILLEIKFGN